VRFPFQSIRQCLLTFLLLIQAIPVHAEPEPSDSHEGMVRIPGGVFSMGGDPGLMNGGSQSHGTSYPIHEVKVDAFWMDASEVTNQEFAAFVEATGYVTFAERPLPKAIVAELERQAAATIQYLQAQAKQASGAEREAIVASIQHVLAASDFSQNAGAIIFQPPQQPLSGSNDITQWWQIETSANWRNPDGAGSNWVDCPDHPVVNVTREDAAAYAKWAGKRLPTEAEWERAARGGLDRQPYAWGDTFSPKGASVWMANIWQGIWPYENSGEDGFIATAPVASFPPNPYGLYDIAGNVWEIVADNFHPRTYSMREEGATNPTGPDAESLRQLGQRTPTYVTRGGSFLCSDSWCSGYQPGSRQSQENDSPAHHTGFRCVKDIE